MPIFSAAISQTLYDYINNLITAEQAGPDVVALAALLNPIFGTDGEDKLSGTSAADVLFGGASQDFFFGGKGNDLIYTGSGTDYVRAGAGDDTLLGEDGDDRLWGDNGNDLIYGGIGRDRIYGGADDDTMYGGGDADIGIGGSGNDSLYGGAGNDAMRGGIGDDRLWGGIDNDKLWGDAGDDRISGDAGDDKLYGGDGNDIISGGTGNDQIYGDAGNDTIITGSGIDTIYGGDGDDWLNLGDGVNLAYGGIGADTYVHSSGTTTIADFETGLDSLVISGEVFNGDNFGISTSNELINLTSNQVVGHVAAGNDLVITLETGTINIAGVGLVDFGVEIILDVILPYGIATVIWTDNNDFITGGHGDQAIFGGLGNDHFSGLHGNDYVFGGEGNDSFTSAINIKVETVHVYGGEGDDTFTHTDRSNDGDALEWFGGNGADIFRIANGFGNITIHDFEAGIDTLEFIDIGVGSDEVFAFEGNIYNDFRFAIDPSIQPVATYITNANGDVVISYGNSTTTITGASIDDLGLNINTVHGGLTDVVLGAATNVNGGAGNETIIGTDDLDLLYGGAGNDLIVGGGGQTSSTISTGWNYTNYVVRGDTIYGGDGDDIIFGDVNPDETLPTDLYTQNVIYGGAGDDIIHSGVGTGVTGGPSSHSGFQDHVFGGAGADTFIVSHGSRTVAFDYAMQEDTIIFHGEALNAENFYLSDSGDIISIDTGEILGHAQVAPNSVNNSGLSGYSGTVRGSYVEAVYVTSFGDDDAANSIIVLRGYDSIDDLNLARESLNLVGTDADDILNGDGGTDQLYGLAGNDTLYGGRSADQLFGGADNDTLYGDAGDDILTGGQGNDRMTGGSGDDTFAWNTGDGRDFITDFTAGQDSLTIDGLVVDSDNFQVTDGDLSLRGQSEVIGTINESTNGLSILLDGGSVVILGATLSDLDIAAPETTLYGTAGIDDFFSFNLADEGSVDIVDFEVGADTVYLVTGITDADYSGLFVGSDGRIFTDYEDPYTTQTYGDTIGQVTFVNGNTVITAEGFQDITVIGATLAYTDIAGY